MPRRRSELGLAALLPGFDQVAEARELAFEAEFDRADRAVALLADDDLGLAVQLFHAFLPGGDFIEPVIRGFLAFGVIFLAEDEHHHIRVLFDRAGFAQVAKLRALSSRDSTWRESWLR